MKTYIINNSVLSDERFNEVITANGIELTCTEDMTIAISDEDYNLLLQLFPELDICEA